MPEPKPARHLLHRALEEGVLHIYGARVKVQIPDVRLAIVEVRQIELGQGINSSQLGFRRPLMQGVGNSRVTDESDIAIFL